jgi:hypothetical protein
MSETKVRSNTVTDQTPISLGVAFLILGCVAGGVATVTALTTRVEAVTSRLEKMEMKLDHIEQVLMSKSNE